MFQRLSCDDLSKVDDVRFEYFTSKVLLQALSSSENHWLIFIPSYLDFVRIRNYMKKQDHLFTFCSEYERDKVNKKARSIFKKGEVQFMLVTERYHYYHRIAFKGAHHMIVYSLPMNAIFYSEYLNYMEESEERSSMSCTVLFSKYEKLQLERIVGDARCERMINGDKNTFLFC